MHSSLLFYVSFSVINVIINWLEISRAGNSETFQRDSERNVKDLRFPDEEMRGDEVATGPSLLFS